jgi:hypothetical protein
MEYIRVNVQDMGPRSDRQGIKIPREAHEELKVLAAEAARYGWAAFGIDRADPPTMTALLEAAIRLLGERREQVKKQGRKR